MNSKKVWILILCALALSLMSALALAEPQAVTASAPIAVGQKWSFTVEGSFQNAKSPTVVDPSSYPVVYRLFKYADGTKNWSNSIEIAYAFQSYNCVRNTSTGTYYGNYRITFSLKPLTGTPAGQYHGEISFYAPQAVVCTVDFTVKPAANGLLHDSNTGAEYLVSSNGKNLSFKALTNANKKTFTIPANVKIGTVNYPVTKVEANALKDNAKLTTLVIGKNVTSIGNYAFRNCAALKKVSGGTGVTTLGRGVFYLDKKLTTVNLGSKLKTIGVQAFYKCSTLASVTIPVNVTKISTQAFYGCTKLSTITIKTTKLVTGSIAKNAFGGTPAPTFKVPSTKVSTYDNLIKKSGLNIFTIMPY